MNEFQRARTSVFAKQVPRTATTEDNMTKIYNLQWKVRELAVKVGTSKDREGHILHEIWYNTYHKAFSAIDAIFALYRLQAQSLNHVIAMFNAVDKTRIH